jgi:hypothetical protein
MAIERWMAWEGGVDVGAMTAPGLPMPNVLVHVARMVHTPLGSAPSGMILYQPDPQGQPAAMGFISTVPKIGDYCGPNIFAGTPFEPAPTLAAEIQVTSLPGSVIARVKVGSFLFEVYLSDLGPLELINRVPAAMPPFFQQGLEAKANKVSVKVNGQELKLILPPMGIAGGPAAVSSPCGVYAR